MLLYNRVDKKILKKKLEEENLERKTVSFYKYIQIENPSQFRDELFIELSKFDILGRIFVANEGINAQISVPAQNFESFRDYLYSLPGFYGLRLNVAIEDNGKSFFKLKIKVRFKIVSDGITDPNFNPSNTGTHLNAETFNELTDRDDVVLVDMRNHYESEVGHFENAILPDVDTFRDSLPIVEDMLQNARDKHVVMYCTGGIRCEKASAYLKHKGFEKVYQLNGGIINYAIEVKEKGLVNKFKGKNFVFDDRLGERITNDVISKCHQCGALCDMHTNCRNDGCHLLFIQCANCAEKFENTCSEACHQIVKLPEEAQIQLRKGINKGRQVFKKGRFQPL